MSITISTVDSTDRERWDRHVERSPHGTVFHRYAALESQRDHSGWTLYPLIGHKGEEPVGIFPVFATRSGPIAMVFSPPAELGVPYLGPALLADDQLSQRKREKRHGRFVEGCIEWIDENVDPRYVYLETGWRYADLRPFAWNDFDVAPAYTYVLPLDGPPSEEELLDRFSRNVRRRIRNADEYEYAVDVGGVEEIEWIIGRVRDRLAEQGRTPRLTAAFVADLHERLPEGAVRPYVLSVDGEPVTGVVALEDGDTVRSWQGGATPDVDFPASDLLEWHMIRDAIDRGARSYEIVGANTPRLNEWKTKFGPEIRTYFSAKRSTAAMDVAEHLYVNLRDRSSLVANLSP